MDDTLLGVSLDSTSVCNLRCTICSLDEAYVGKGVMTPATFARLDDAFPRLKHLALSVNAEPLMNPHLVEMLDRAKQASDGAIVTSFTTNATLLDEPRARALIEHGLDALEVSMDGATRATYENIRIRADFEQVVANTGRLARLKRELGRSTPHLSLRFVVCTHNAHELLDFLDLARRLEIDHVVVNGLEAYSPESWSTVLYGRQADPRVVELFESVEERALQQGMRVDLPLLAPQPIDDCHLIDHSCVILWDGLVVPCSPLGYRRTFQYFEQTLEHPQVTFGNIRERSLFDIWNSAEYRSFRSDLQSGVVHEECTACLKRAGVICPLHHWRWLEAKPVQPPAAEAARSLDA